MTHITSTGAITAHRPFNPLDYWWSLVNFCSTFLSSMLPTSSASSVGTAPKPRNNDRPLSGRGGGGGGGGGGSGGPSKNIRGMKDIGAQGSSCSTCSS